MKGLSLLLLLFVGSCSLAYAFAQQAAPIIVKAAEFAEKQPNDSIDTLELFEVAQKWQQVNNPDAWTLYHYLADDLNHVPSMARLGFHYPETDDRALLYFQRAGDEGPHHASLYNAGRILAQRQDWVQALFYLKAAATLAKSYPDYEQESITKIATEAHETVSQQVPDDVTFIEMADVFMFGSLSDLSKPVEALWRNAITSLVEYSANQDTNSKDQAVSDLKLLLKSHSNEMTPLQSRMVTNALNAMQEANDETTEL
jgi:tetratricopeptide (TPR) repeat protein